MTADEIEEGVRDELRRLMALPADAVIAREHLLVDDVGLDSLDLVELIYRLERRFSIEISEGTLVRLARGELSDADFFDEEYLTPLGRERAMALLHDTPRARFPPDVHRSTLPLYATVGALARVIAALLGVAT